jgi:hypothetical protein
MLRGRNSALAVKTKIRLEARYCLDDGSAFTKDEGPSGVRHYGWPLPPAEP